MRHARSTLVALPIPTISWMTLAVDLELKYTGKKGDSVVCGCKEWFDYCVDADCRHRWAERCGWHRRRGSSPCRIRSTRSAGRWRKSRSRFCVQSVSIVTEWEKRYGTDLTWQTGW